MAESSGGDLEVLRWYTSALRIPRLIGKLSSGERIWGGPYTVTQAIVGGCAFVGGVQTMPSWAQLHLFGQGLTGFIGNWALVAGATFGILKVAGVIPASRVNARVALGGGARQLRGRRAATWRGQLLTTGRTGPSRGRINITDVPMPATSRRDRAAEPPADTRPVVLTALPEPVPTRSVTGATSTPSVVEKLSAFVGR